ncbi:MAG: hypothetical protein BGO41_06050 [Clostridiales bacterium 38-18]|nr:MAG: hypothetical protein BGO41_06050 [Clostridiales bacterium 38-18]
MQMRKRKPLIRTLVLMLCVLLIGNSAISMAVTDVTSSHWAKAQIGRMIDNKIMPTYANGAFQPDAVVTSLEVMTAAYRAVKGAGLLDSVQMGTLTSKYEASLKSVGVPQMLSPYDSDTYPALAFALEYKILTLEEIKVFINGTTITNVKKVNATVIIAKTLNVFKQENLNKIILLKYKDAAEISLSAIKYVNLLIEHSIISSTGDSLGNFNPNNTINRATLAVMIDGLYSSLKTGDNVKLNSGETATEGTTEATTEGTSEDKPVGIETEKTVNGTVVKMDDGTFTVTIKNASGKEESYKLDEATMSIKGSTGTYYDIVIGSVIEITVKNGVATGVALTEKLSAIEGKFVQLSGYIGTTNKRRSIKVAVSATANEFRNVYEDTLVTINGVPASANDLKPDYKVIVYYKEYDAKRIIAYSDAYEFYGILNDSFTIATTTKVGITMENGTIFSGVITPKVIFVNSSAGYNKGDIVKATLKYGEIVKVEWIGQAKTVVGDVTGINIKKNPEISILLSNGKTETYGFSSKAKLLNETGDNAITIYDLRLDQEVTVEIGIGGIVQLQQGRKIIAEPTAIKATVSQVVDSSNILIVTDESNRMRTVTFPTGSVYKASNYKAGMVLYIEGKAIADTIFEVIKITVQAQ